MRGFVGQMRGRIYRTEVLRQTIFEGYSLQQIGAVGFISAPGVGMVTVELKKRSNARLYVVHVSVRTIHGMRGANQTTSIDGMLTRLSSESRR